MANPNPGPGGWPIFEPDSGWCLFHKSEVPNEHRRSRSARKMCRRGHQFTTKNTYVDKRGHKNCLTCKKLMAKLRLSSRPANGSGSPAARRGWGAGCGARTLHPLTRPLQWGKNKCPITLGYGGTPETTSVTRATCRKPNMAPIACS